jgi:hypothetical protein
MKSIPGDLTYKKIIRFWLPLLSTWLMMSVEGPYLAAIIARLPDAKINLAAYGVAFSFAILIESPVIMIMSAATAIVENRFTFYKLRQFTNILNLIITIFSLLVVIPGIFNFIAYNLMKLPVEVAELTHTSLIILIPWPAAIGFRRFYQGVMIRNGLTRRVAYGTVIRVSTMGVSAFILYRFFNISGALVGAGALSVGVMMEAAASRIMAASSVNYVIGRSEGRSDYSLLRILKFYYPLALMPMLALSTQPLIVFFVGQGKYPLESLAVLPVINGLIFIFKSVGLSFHEAAITFLTADRKNYAILHRVSLFLAITSTTLLALIVFTPLIDVWFVGISGLSVELSGFSIIPTQIMLLMPALSVWISFQRAFLVSREKTLPITFATVVEVIGIIIIMLAGTKVFYGIGAVVASLAQVAGRLSANFYLMLPIKSIFKINGKLQN